MEQVTYTSLRKNLAHVMDKVSEDHQPIMITRQNGKAGVLMSLDDFHSYEETAYLLASPVNVQRLHDSLVEVKNNQLSQHSLRDEEL